jgi:hypothetical protein
MSAEMWGLDSEGSFITKGAISGAYDKVIDKFKIWLNVHQKSKLNVYEAILSDLRRVRNSAVRELTTFDELSSNLDIDSASKRILSGKKLLLLFQMDLLPGINAMILESKASREASSQPVTTYAKKAIALTFVVMVNVGILFYIYLFALQQSSERQSAWFWSFIVWLLLEVFVVSTVMVFISHFLIPSMIMRDLYRVKKRLITSIEDYKKRIRAPPKDVKNTNQYGNKAVLDDSARVNDDFNVAKYFFVSNRVARNHPELLESKIILGFSSPWPHQSYMHTRSVSDAYAWRFSAIIRGVVVIITYLFKGFLSLPPGIQDILVNLSTVVISGNFISVLIDWYQINPLLVFIPVLLLVLLVHFAMKLFSHFVGAKYNIDDYKMPELLTKPYLVRESSKISPYSDDGVVYINETIPDNSATMKPRRQSIAEGVHVLHQLEALQRDRLGSSIASSDIRNHSMDRNHSHESSNRALQSHQSSVFSQDYLRDVLMCSVSDSDCSSTHEVFDDRHSGASLSLAEKSSSSINSSSKQHHDLLSDVSIDTSRSGTCDSSDTFDAYSTPNISITTSNRTGVIYPQRYSIRGSGSSSAIPHKQDSSSITEEVVIYDVSSSATSDFSSTSGDSSSDVASYMSD